MIQQKPTELPEYNQPKPLSTRLKPLIYVDFDFSATIFRTIVADSANMSDFPVSIVILFGSEERDFFKMHPRNVTNRTRNMGIQCFQGIVTHLSGFPYHSSLTTVFPFSSRYIV